ncbi:MAG: SDR family oxidoreductase [Halobacteria archaeon]|nr:SDR family oxidoreductase [Halobacteria archaeon]
MDRVLVAGASGGTGRQIMMRLKDTDLDVRALTRSPRKEGKLRDLGADDVVKGDLLDDGDTERAVQGVDAVLCAVGPSPMDILLGRELVDGKGVINLVDASTRGGVSKFVFESAIGVGNSKKKLPLPFRLPIIRSLRAKKRAESTVRSSTLSHTVLRPGILTNGEARKDTLVAEGGPTVFGFIRRADVARLMVASLFTHEADNRTFEVVSGKRVWGETNGLVEVDWEHPDSSEGRS